MYKIYYLLLQCQKQFQFTHTWQMVKFTFANIIVSLLEALGFIPLFWLVSIMAQPNKEIINIPYIGIVFQKLGIQSYTLGLVTLSFFLCIIFIGKGWLQLLYYNRLSRISASWGNIIERKVFLNYFKSDYEKLLGKDLIQVSANLSATTSITLEFLVPLVLLISYIVQVGVLLVLLVYYVQATLAIIILLLLGFGYFMNHFYLRNRLASIRLRLIDRGQEKSHVNQRSIYSIKESRLSGNENNFIQEYTNFSSANAMDNATLGYYQIVPSQFIEMISIILIIFSFIGLTLTTPENGNLLIKTGLILGVVLRIMPYVGKIFYSFNQAKSCSALVERILNEYKFFKRNQTPNMHVTKPIDFDSTIKLENISYQYDKSSLPALHNINLTIKKGEFIGILGASGSGKSTLINILMGFLSPKKGKIFIDNVQLEKKHIPSWYSHIGLVDQIISIGKITIAENIAYGVAKEFINENKVVECLKKAQLWDFVKTLPKGIWTKVGRGEKILSGGQEQRLVIARALYRDISLLVLDEATASLDLGTEQKFFEFLVNLKGQLTVVMVAHRLSSLKSCDRLIFLRNGNIKSSGNFAELEKNDEEFKAYLLYSRM